MNSPFSRERSGQKEARIVCSHDASFREHMRVKYPLAFVVMLKCQEYKWLCKIYHIINYH